MAKQKSKDAEPAQAEAATENAPALDLSLLDQLGAFCAQAKRALEGNPEAQAAIRRLSGALGSAKAELEKHLS